MKSVYIHVPFCQSICSYCDFCKMFYHPGWVKAYLQALEMEINDFYMNDEIKTIYIGGGTPSVLSLEELESLLKLTLKFSLKNLQEFTFECNLNDINEKLLAVLKKYHVNRLSVGIESFTPHVLKVLGRDHSFLEAQEKMQLMRDFGFQNINIDLIYAVPGQTLKDLKSDLKKFLQLKPDHISTYSLIIEPHTLLSIKNIQPINEELDREFYDYICKKLKQKGYHHYEISNFALENKASIHNLTYWHNEEYYGFGLSASGYIDQIRYTNTRNLKEYLKGKFRDGQDLLTKQDIMDNELMLGLRLIKGVSKNEFFNKYQERMEDIYPIEVLLKNKDLQEKKEYICIPSDKLYIMNEILLKFI